MIPESRTSTRIEDLVMWSALGVYALVWLLGLGIGLGGAWWIAVVATASYVGMHVFEITRRGHCYLSADSTAAPISLLVFSGAVMVLWVAGRRPLPDMPALVLWALYGGVFMVGHIAAIVYAAVATSLLLGLFHGRIHAERRESRGALSQDR